MRHRWIRIGLVAIGFVLLASLAVRPAGVRLADGTYLRVLAATVGPNHSFSTGAWFVRRPLVWLPLPLRDRLGWRGYSLNLTVADSASVMLWLASYSPATRSLKPRTFTAVELVDAEGNVLSQGAQAAVPVPSREAGLVLLPGVTHFPTGSRLRFRYGPPPGWVTELDSPRRLN
jgi:hypothetical protein